MSYNNIMIYDVLSCKQRTASVMLGEETNWNESPINNLTCEFYFLYRSVGGLYYIPIQWWI